MPRTSSTISMTGRDRLDRAGDRWMADAEAKSFARELGLRRGGPLGHREWPRLGSPSAERARDPHRGRAAEGQLLRLGRRRAYWHSSAPLKDVVRPGPDARPDRWPRPSARLRRTDWSGARRRRWRSPPWPGTKVTSSPSGHSLVTTDWIRAAGSLRGKSVRPTEPWNSTSPTWAKRGLAIEEDRHGPACAPGSGTPPRSSRPASRRIAVVQPASRGEAARLRQTPALVPAPPCRRSRTGPPDEAR